MTSVVDPCRRPIASDEVPALEELGRRLSDWRTRAGLSVRELANELAMNRTHMWRLEGGRRRTRRSTLAEIALVIARACGERDDRVDHAAVLADLLAAGGHAIAPESRRSRGSVARKRKRREKENLRHDLAAVRRIVGDAEPVHGGPRYMLRRRIDGALFSQAIADALQP